MTTMDLMGSLIIGGILLLSIVTFQLFFSDVSRNTVLSEIHQGSSTNIARVVESDFVKLGYRVPAVDKILELANNRISFLADLNNDGVVDSVRYTYTAISKSLMRYSSVGQNKFFIIKVDSFALRGYDLHGAITNFPPDLSTLQVDLLVQDIYATTKGTEKLGIFWMRRFFPVNMQL